MFYDRVGKPDWIVFSLKSPIDDRAKIFSERPKLNFTETEIRTFYRTETEPKPKLNTEIVNVTTIEYK